MAGNWSQAPWDVLSLVAEQMTTVINMARFGAVCKSWRSLLLQHNWFGLPIEAIGKSSLPRLMLAETDNSDTRGFFDLATGQVLEIHLPEARGRRCCGSSHGWVVTMGEDFEIHLLNPLSREQVRLPPQTTFGEFWDGHTNEHLHAFYASEELSGNAFTLREELRRRFMMKAMLTCSPRSGDGDCIVVALILGGAGGIQVAVVRPGEKAWTLPTIPSFRLADLFYHKGCLYAINDIGEVMVWDLDLEHEWTEIATNLYHTSFCPRISSEWRYYLAEVHGDLVAVARASNLEDSGYYYTLTARVFKLDKGQWVQIKDLGDCSLFLGGSSSTSISPVPLGCRRNCIYFTDDNYEWYIGGSVTAGHDMGVFSLDDGTFKPFFNGVSNSYFSQPIWVTLNSSK